MTLDARQIEPAELADRVQQAPVRASEVVFAGRVWDVRRDRVDLGEAGEVVREFVDHPGAVAVLALREDRGAPELLMIQQYRHPVGAYEWELPAGLLDVAGEQPWLAAARELGEEADLRAATWHLLADYVASPGGLSEALRVYLARDLSEVPEGERFVREGEEHGMPTGWVSLESAAEAVLAGRIRNATVAIGVLSVQAALARGWETLRPVDASWSASSLVRRHSSSPRR